MAGELADGVPYVVRFRAPELSGDGRVSFADAIRGKLAHEANRNDVVILKASDQSPRLPTYHFAHAVDDHLMRVNLVIRGEEWISLGAAAPAAVRRRSASTPITTRTSRR